MDEQCTIVIPAFNEEACLADVLQEALAWAGERNWRVVVVDDGSTDGTRDVSRDFANDRLTFIRHKVNKGYGGALKTGIASTTTPYVVTIDADGQHDLSDIDRLLAIMESADADLIVGSRPTAKGLQEIYRRVGKLLIRGVAKTLLPLKVKDLNSGMKLYRGPLARKYIALCPDSMAFSDIITLVFISEKRLVLEEPINIRPRRGGVSTISAQTAFETLMEIINIVVLFNPMRIFLPLALILGISGSLWGMVFVLQGQGVSVGALLGIVSGLTLFAIGLLAEQLSVLRKATLIQRDEIKNDAAQP